MSIKSAKEVFDENASLYEKKFMDFDLYNDTYDTFCRLLRPDAHVLEIGCGPGNITRYLLDKRPDLKILATDFSPEMIKLAQKHNPEAEFELLDCREISSLNRKFDAVVIGFCVPYLDYAESTKLLADSADLMTGSGLIYLSSIEDKHDKSQITMSSDGKMGTMVYKYLQSDFENMFGAADLKTIDVFRKPFPSKTNVPDVHLVLIAGKRNAKAIVSHPEA